MQTLHRRAVSRPEPDDYDKKFHSGAMRELVQGGEVDTGEWIAQHFHDGGASDPNSAKLGNRQGGGKSLGPLSA